MGTDKWTIEKAKKFPIDQGQSHVKVSGNP